MDIILKYFPSLTAKQIKLFEKLKPIYEDLNSKVNVISRKDMDSFYEHHVLHSLAIAQVVKFKDNTHIVDVGTGGGFPGIPLAILFPNCKFLLVDSIGKKIKLVDEVIAQLGISNVRTMNERAENIDLKCDFIVSRAVTQMPVFIDWVKHLIKQGGNNYVKNGILYLKGGDLTAELTGIPRKIKQYDISKYFTEPFFETKKLVYVKF